MEGYGHYINQARAFGGVIITTNASPMNELIGSSAKDANIFLGDAFKGKHGLRRVDGTMPKVTSDGIYRAVEKESAS